MNDKEIKKFLDAHSDLFDSLANDIRCPSCSKITKPPHFNLGKKFNWFEGCEDCYNKIEKE